MPTSIQNIVDRFNLKIDKTVKWNEKVQVDDYGIYIVAFDNEISTTQNKHFQINFSDSQVALWMQNAPNIKLYNKEVNAENLKTQLAKFWIPDETILYIGKAEKQFLSDRISQFYWHKVGKKSPHKGGYWLKLLADLDKFYIHVIKSNDPARMEKEVLKYFIDNVSETSKKMILDSELCLPFANLQLRSGVIKKHGLSNHYQ